MKTSNRQNCILTGSAPPISRCACNERSIAAPLIGLTAIIDDSIGNEWVRSRSPRYTCVALRYTRSVAEDRSKLPPSPRIQRLGQGCHLGSGASVVEIDAERDRTVAFFTSIYQRQVGSILGVLL